MLLEATLHRLRRAVQYEASLRGIQKYCHDWVTWWGEVKRTCADYDSNFYQLVSCENAHDSMHLAAYRLQYASSRVGRSSPITLSLPTMPIDRLTWRPKSAYNWNFSGLKTHYKSLRRHLRKRFGRHHQRCIRCFGWPPADRLNTVEDRCTNCPVAIVYDRWRRLHERYSDAGPFCTFRLLGTYAVGCEQFRSDLYYLYAAFVEALNAVCSIDRSRSYVLTDMPACLAEWTIQEPDPEITVLIPHQAILQVRLAKIHCEAVIEGLPRWQRCNRWHGRAIAMAVFAADLDEDQYKSIPLSC